MKEQIHFSLIGIILLVSAVVIGFSPSIYKSILKISILKKELHSYKERHNNLNHEIDDYIFNIENLNKDFYKEKIARSKLQLVKQGEQIYKISEN